METDRSSPGPAAYDRLTVLLLYRGGQLLLPVGALSDALTAQLPVYPKTLSSHEHSPDQTPDSDPTLKPNSDYYGSDSETDLEKRTRRDDSGMLGRSAGEEAHHARVLLDFAVLGLLMGSDYLPKPRSLGLGRTWAAYLSFRLVIACHVRATPIYLHVAYLSPR